MKTRTPVSSVILYIFGIIFLIVAIFMLITAINYTKMYLASYETTFEEMWSNSVQYIIEKFLPYFAVSVICIGVGKAISVFKKSMAAVAAPNVSTDEAAPNRAQRSDDEIAVSLKELREVGSIKLDELERREKVRLDDMRETVIRDMAIHRLQREAKEEEIISKINALGEKMGIDMMELYASADIPVVPETDPQIPDEESKLDNDPLFEELESIETAETMEEAEQSEAIEEAETTGDEQVLTQNDEPGVPEQTEETSGSEEIEEQQDAPEEDAETEELEAEDAETEEPETDDTETEELEAEDSETEEPEAEDTDESSEESEESEETEETEEAEDTEDADDESEDSNDESEDPEDRG